jgi:hypothetical protein
MQEHLGYTDIAPTALLLAEWVPIAGLEARFGFSKSTSYRLVAEELVEARKVGGKTLVNLASVRRYIANQPPPNIKADERSAKLVAAGKRTLLAAVPAAGVVTAHVQEPGAVPAWRQVTPQIADSSAD